MLYVGQLYIVEGDKFVEFKVFCSVFFGCLVFFELIIGLVEVKDLLFIDDWVVKLGGNGKVGIWAKVYGFNGFFKGDFWGE